MATLKGRAQHKLFAVRKKVRIPPLSVGDANAIAMTVMRSSARALLRAAYNSNEARKFPRKPDENMFVRDIDSVLDLRHGSIYAAFVTAVDNKKTFHGERFAVALARLGVTGDLEAKVTANSFSELGELIALKAPWFWADLIVKEILTVRKEVTTFMGRMVSMFREEITNAEVDELIESVLHQQPLAAASPRMQMMRGAASLQVDGGYNQIYLGMFRRLAQHQKMTLLPTNSSLDAVFETFLQHLMTNPSALQRVLPGAQFGGTKITAANLQRLFRDPNVIRKLKAAFTAAYDAAKHDIPMDKLYRAMRRYNLQDEIDRSARLKLKKKLSPDAINGIVSGIVGLFYAFAGDTHGQSFPAMAAMKR